MDTNLIKQHLESKGWVVKTGLLYGSDFVLYKPSSLHSHSEYLIKCISSPPTYRELLGSLRCCTSVKKVIPKQTLILATTDLHFYQVTRN